MFYINLDNRLTHFKFSGAVKLHDPANMKLV